MRNKPLKGFCSPMKTKVPKLTLESSPKEEKVDLKIVPNLGYI